MVSEHELETVEKQGLTCLLGVQLLCTAQVSRVFVIGAYNKGETGALQPVAPLLESKHYRQELPVAHIIIYLGR